LKKSKERIEQLRKFGIYKAITFKRSLHMPQAKYAKQHCSHNCRGRALSFHDFVFLGNDQATWVMLNICVVTIAKINKNMPIST
jgi:hypothetical protein